MKFIKVLFAQSLFIIIFCLPVFAQNDTAVLKRIIVKTSKLYNDQPVEKVYLHFDKPYYAVGDTIWFKAYLTIDQHQPSPLSKIIYVDIFGPRDSLVESLKLPVKNGVAWANVDLSPLTYKQANYRIIAYTNWMNNADPAYFFNKNITIGNTVNNELYTHVSLKRAVENNLSKITAGIVYKDDKGAPYSGKKVSWTAITDDETIVKGKAITDQNGYIAFSFTNTRRYNLDSARINTAIDIGNRTIIPSSFPLRSVARSIDMQFFPEGGELIYGVFSKVAFKAIRPDGLGIGVKGTITDNDNKVIAEFTSAHAGMGVFKMAPAEGKTYRANVTFADGTKGTYDLPKIRSAGISLSVDNDDPEVLKVKLQAGNQFFQQNQGKIFFILGQTDGIVCYAAQTKLSSQVYSASIPKNKFPTGIVQLTVFSSDGDPLSERIAFIQHNDQLNLTINSDKPLYANRQKVKLNIAAKSNNQPVEGNFSIAVIDESKVPFDENKETTILTSLLLTSDLKGYIEKPNYYFNHPIEKTIADLDILMLTQGYRRFNYKDILNDRSLPVMFAPEQGIEIAGTLRTLSGIPFKGGNVRLLIPDKNYSANAVTDINGRFKFTGLLFSDPAKVNLSARNNFRSSNLMLQIDGDPYQKIPFNYNTPDEILNIDSTISPYLKNSKMQYNNSHMLKEVEIKDKKNVPTISHRDYPALVGLSSEPDHLIVGDQLKGCSVFLNCLKTMAVGMTFDIENFYVSRDYNSGRKVPARIYVKGMPVDFSYLSSINSDEVESVEIFLKDELGLVNRANQTNGIIVVNMKKAPTGTKISLDELGKILPQANELSFTPKGYVTVRTFYSPRYDGPGGGHNIGVDTRSTIYWNPNVITDKTGMATLDYFNGDGEGTYRVIIEGIDNNGNIGRQVYKYKVQ